MICLVGGCPSSGSTLLADLLDSTPFSVSGPELEFFCNPSLYSYSSFKKNTAHTGKLFAARSTDIYFRSDFLSHYGYSKEEWENQIQDSNSLTEFTEAFTHNFLAFRKKESDGIVFEKTPQNTNCIGEFLEAFPDSYYIHIVRNPANVFSSLRKRNFGSYTAGATWLLYACKAREYRNHPRYIEVSYEELIANPFEVVRQLFKKIAPGRHIPAEEIKVGFEKNSYRQNVTGIASWENTNRTTVNPVQKEISMEDKELLSGFLTMKVGASYAALFGITPLSFKTAMENTGYHELLEELKNTQRKPFPKRSIEESKKLFTKWMKGLRKGNFSITDLSSLFKTLEKAEIYL